MDIARNQQVFVGEADNLKRPILQVIAN